MAKSKLKYSIVVATRNRDKTLHFLLKSLALQSFPQSSYEVLIVDYGGDTSTRKLVKSFRKRNFRYMYVDEKGIFNESHSKNIGVKNSRGKVIIVTNSDIIFTKDTLKEFDKEYRRLGEKYLYQVIRYDMPEKFNVSRNFDLLLNKKISLNKFKSQDETACGDFQAAERSFWYSVNGYDELMSGWGGMDLDLVDRMRMISCKQKWITKPDLLIYHQYHPTKAPAKTQANLFLRSLNTDPKVNYKSWGEAGKKKKLYVAIYDSSDLKNKKNLSKKLNGIFKGLAIKLLFNFVKDNNSHSPKSFFQATKIKALEGKAIGYLEIDKLHPNIFNNLKVITKENNHVDIILAMKYILKGSSQDMPMQYNLRYFDMRSAKIISSINLKSMQYFYTKEIVNAAKKIGLDVRESNVGEEVFDGEYHSIKFFVEKIKYTYHL